MWTFRMEQWNSLMKFAVHIADMMAITVANVVRARSPDQETPMPNL